MEVKQTAHYHIQNHKVLKHIVCYKQRTGLSWKQNWRCNQNVNMRNKERI